MCSTAPAEALAKEGQAGISIFEFQFSNGFAFIYPY
jgi:hypothetical protein